ncbi:MAG: hypothetical protein R3A80_03290 [Bdellovibrionota bacterium]
MSGCDEWQDDDLSVGSDLSLSYLNRNRPFWTISLTAKSSANSKTNSANVGGISASFVTNSSYKSLLVTLDHTGAYSASKVTPNVASEISSGTITLSESIPFNGSSTISVKGSVHYCSEYNGHGTPFEE